MIETRLTPYLLLALVATGTACRAPAPPPPFDVSRAVERLSSLSVDDGWVRLFEELAEHAGDSAEARAATFRFSVAGAAAAIASRAPAAGRLMGSEPPDAAAASRFLEGAAALADREEDQEVVRSLAAAFTRSGDLGPAVLAARGDGPLAGPCRLLLATRVLDAVTVAAAAPEVDRTDALLDAMPNLPISGEAHFPGPPAFPNALLHLSELLRGGPGREAALSPHFARVAVRAEQALSGRPFPQPVHLAPLPPTGPKEAGLSCRQCPLAVLTVRPEGYGIGARPVIAWQAGRVVNLTGDVGWPGPVLWAGGAAPADAARAVRERLDQVLSVVRPVEARLWPGREPTRSMLVAVDSGARESVVREAMNAAAAAGVTSLALLPPGRIGVALPLMAGPVPAALAPNPAAARVVVALRSDAGLVVLVPPPGSPPAPPPMEASWQPERGYKGRLAVAVGKARAAAGAGPVVEVQTFGADVSGWQVMDTVAEILASEGSPMSGVEARFPGLVCATGRCPAAIPHFPPAARQAGPGG